MTSHSDGAASSHKMSASKDGKELALEPLTVITGPQLGAIRYVDDESMLAAAQAKAEEARKRIEAQGWSVPLRRGQPHYVKCEGWVALAALCGLTPTVIGTSELADGSRAAVAELRDACGHAYVRADAECGDQADGNGKRSWATEPGYAKRSMAQTRAVAKCCRVALSWVMSLAGYAPTPWEEVAGRDFDGSAPIKEERLRACILAMRNNARSFAEIFENLDPLADGIESEMRAAATAWFELDAETKKAVWIAPSDGGPFTTQERSLMKSSDFRKLHFGEGE